jgi:hypothetical protein
MRILHWFEGLLKHADREATFRALWFALLCLFALILLLRPWNGNEEYYFQLAYRTFSPDSFSGFHAVFDKSVSRYLVEYPIGWLVSVIGYDSAHTVVRTGQVIVYATGFTILFKGLKFSVLDALAVIAIVVITGEQLYGGEWLFKGTEAKTFAYGAVVGAIGFGMRSNWQIAVVLMAIATWMHFLVGGFWMVALALFHFLRTKVIARSFQLVALYSLLVLPLIILIGIEQFGQMFQQTSPSPTEIYVQRNSHHIAPYFGAVGKWEVWKWVEGIAATSLMFLAFAIYLPNARDSALTKLVVLLLLYMLIALAVSYFDRNTFLVSKLYLFRPSSLTLLLAIVVILSELRHSMFQRSELIRQLALTTLVLLFLMMETKSSLDYVSRSDDLHLTNLVSAAEQYSDPNEIVLVQPLPLFGRLDTFLPRQLDRPTLVSYKYVPTPPEYLIRWNELLERRKQLFMGDCDALSEYPVSLLVVVDETVLDSVRGCGDIVWQDKKSYLVRLQN